MGCKKRKLWEKTIRNKSRRQHGRRALDKTKPRRDPRSTNLRVKLRIDSVSRVTCCHPWSQGLVRGASAHFVTLQTVLHLMTGLPMQLSSERQELTAREADYPDTAHSSPDLKNKVINTGWEEARDWLLLPSQFHRYSPGQCAADCVELHQIDLRKDITCRQYGVLYFTTPCSQH
uniref:Uncharacterized protein n=2 Tax=Timema TaxID=61471 RepID=A0A7R9B3L0_TIMSH|nr:unnamed protein product [Timema shepardi]